MSHSKSDMYKLKRIALRVKLDFNFKRISMIYLWNKFGRIELKIYIKSRGYLKMIMVIKTEIIENEYTNYKVTKLRISVRG